MTVPPRLFCDTSFFYACLDLSDVNHSVAARFVDEAAQTRSDFMTTWDVVSETVTLLRYRHSFAAAWTLMSEIKPRLRLVSYGEGTRAEAEEVFRIYAKDHRLSLLRCGLLRRRNHATRQSALPGVRSRLQEIGSDRSHLTPGSRWPRICPFPGPGLSTCLCLTLATTVDEKQARFPRPDSQKTNDLTLVAGFQAFPRRGLVYSLRSLISGS